MGRKSVKQDKSVYQCTREALGLTREAASELLDTISPERLERLENEKVNMLPADVLELSRAYKKPALCNHYCSHDCEIGRNFGREIEEKTLAQIAIETYNCLTQLDAVKNRLFEIVGDGEVTPDEYTDFNRIRETMNTLSDTVESLRLWVRTAEAQGVYNSEE